jgi:DNA-directed RNA polymerase beta subunit
MAKKSDVRPQKYFGKFREPLVKLPSLVESQIKSFTDFVEGGAEKVFKEFSEISRPLEEKIRA